MKFSFSEWCYEDVLVSQKMLLIISLISAIIFTVPALIFFPLSNADGYVHEYYVRYFANLFLEGALYPRWLAGLNGGCGEPTFYFYPPLAYYITSIISLFSNSFYFVQAVFIFIVTWLSFLSMFFYLRLFGNDRLAIVASVFYVFLPIKMGSYYYTGAPSEYLVYVFIPIILQSLHCIFVNKNYHYFIILSASMAATLLSSVTTTASLCFFLPLYIIYYLIRYRLNYKIIIYGLLCIALT
ncbi:MAG: hypothetical protein MK137_06260, partial [Rickettsiales bacterium]|nr:hypothetical protein [Rickettsiales bacterium]